MSLRGWYDANMKDMELSIPGRVALMAFLITVIFATAALLTLPIAFIIWIAGIGMDAQYSWFPEPFPFWPVFGFIWGWKVTTATRTGIKTHRAEK